MLATVGFIPVMNFATTMFTVSRCTWSLYRKHSQLSPFKFVLFTLLSEKPARKSPFSRETSEIADPQRLKGNSRHSKKLLSERKIGGD